jgi:hypothetical protein
MEGQIAGEQERRQRDLQAYQQAVSQFQIGHQLEQESRQRAADPYRLALQYAPQIQPGQRGPFISEALGHIAEQENQPFAYGAGQFNDIQNAYRAGNPNAARFAVPNVPTGNNPWVPQVPPAGAFDPGQAQGPPQDQPVPGPAPTPLVHATPEMLQGFGTVLGQPRSETTPLTPDQMAQQAVAGAFPTPAAPPANGLGNELTYQTNQQFPGGMPLRSPNQVPPLGTGPGPVEALNQGVFGSLLPAFQAVQAHTQGVTQTAGAQGGASGSNPQATQPPNTRGQIPDQTPTPGAQMGGGGAAATSTAGAPPPPVPPSASVGTAPQTVPAAGGPPVPTAGTGATVPPPNVLHIPGFSRDYAYGEVDQAAQTRAVARRQAALAHLRDINAPPETLQQVQDLIGRSPNPDTQAGLQQYDFVTQQVESLGIGQGASIYRARQAAQRTPPQLMTQFLAIVGKSGRANDPTWVRQTALGMGIDPALADTLAAGDFGAPEVRKLLGKALDKIYTPGFGQLDPTTQNSLLDAARGYAETLGQKIELPAQVVLQMTPAQRARLDLEKTRIAQSGRAQDIAEGRLKLAQWQTQARIDGLLGGAGGGKGGKLTANAELLAARKPYDEALGVYKSLRAQKAYEDARDAYDTAKNNLLALHPDADSPEKERADIEHIINDPRTDDKARILANADLRRLRTADAYQQKTAALVAAGQPATAPAGARTVVPNFAPGGGQGVGAPAGVPGPGQANPVPMIFTNPQGQKQMFTRDPAAVARYLLGKNPGWTQQQAQRRVQQMIQEAKRGRTRAR